MEYIIFSVFVFGLISWTVKHHHKNNNVEVFKYKTTAHEKNTHEQVYKVLEEKKEFKKAVCNWMFNNTPENATKVSDELNDYINTLIKLNKIFCEENNMNLKTEIKRNIKKNNDRGYYGSNTNKAE